MTVSNRTSRSRTNARSRSSSATIDKIYAAMRESEMATWVGGSDPARIGGANFNAILENVPLRADDVVLDFGCGIGRTAVMLADFLKQGEIVGSDIIPGEIAFCETHVAGAFSNSSFFCLDAANPLYDSFVAATTTATQRLGEGAFFERFPNKFHLVVAFSVFTHFNPSMAEHYVKVLAPITRPGGNLLLTWFLDHPSNPEGSRLDRGQSFLDRDGNLEFALFSPASVEQFAKNAGLEVKRISYGYWREWPWNTLKGQHFQDIVVLGRPMELPPDFDAQRYLALNEDVASAGMDPAKHYLLYGYAERRKIR
jgi:SAM-dependent methyltransferase